jgi:glycosyltransferase involved in cell wall biosynthesis
MSHTFISSPTPKVNILLSTFNGVRFLPEQLDSLLRQDYPNISIYVRDDGSTDGTVELLQEYEMRCSYITLIKGENLGVRHSFFELAYNCGNEGELYAFCDQDDVWSSSKITRSVEVIHSSSNVSMALYCSRLDIVDQELRSIKLSRVPHYIGFKHAVVDSMVYGCSAMFGHGIKQLFLQANPDHMLMHDWWIYLIAATFGDVIYDIQPQVLYRQHGKNVSGYAKGIGWRLKFWIKNVVERLLRDRRNIDFLHQAEHFINTYDVPSEARLVVEDLLSIKNSVNFSSRIRYAFDSHLMGNDPIYNLALKLMILSGCP